VAPLIADHVAPLLSERCHWRAYVMGAVAQSLLLGAECPEALVQGRLVWCGTNVVRAA